MFKTDQQLTVTFPCTSEKYKAIVFCTNKDKW